MSDMTSGAPAAGWYYADGDPPGTVRLWNGTQWVGFPQRDPNAGFEQRVEAFEPTLGQMRLRELGFAVQLALGVVAVAYVFLIVKLLAGIAILDDVDPLTLTPTVDLIQDVGDTIAPGFLFFYVAIALSGLLFVAWFWRAYKNVSLWHPTKHATFWAIWAWFVPFMNMFRPIGIMLELMTHSPRKDREGSLNPVTAVMWWALWLAPGFVGFALNVGSPDATSTLRSALWIQIIASVLNMVALVFAVVLVRQVTWHQDSRLVPSDEQVEQYRKDEARSQFLASAQAPSIPGASG
jgi:hypothetical protein